MDNFSLKLIYSIKIFVCILFYVFFFINTDWILFFLIFSFYFLIRISLDLFFIVASFKYEDWVLVSIEKLTKGKVPKERSWLDRFNGVDKWLLYSYINLLILFFVSFIFL